MGSILIGQKFTCQFVILPVPLEDGVLDDGLLVEGDGAGVDHVVQHELAHGVQVVGGHVEADGAVDDEGAQLEQRVQRQRRHVRLRPPVPALL